MNTQVLLGSKGEKCSTSPLAPLFIMNLYSVLPAGSVSVVHHMLALLGSGAICTPGKPPKPPPKVLPKTETLVIGTSMQETLTHKVMLAEAKMAISASSCEVSLSCNMSARKGAPPI